MKRPIAHLVWTIAFCVTTSTMLFGQDDIMARFVARTYDGDFGSLLYRLFIPEGYSPAQKYPLVLTLHGSGEGGTDNHKQLTGRLATSWADPVNQAKHPCFVVSPQIPYGQAWSDGPYPTLVSSLLDSMAREFSIDANRLYVTGLSLGGFGTWDLIARYPGRFAAAVPMSGGYAPEAAGIMINTPIWNFHGRDDASVPVAFSRDMIDAFKELGHTVVYTNCHNNDCAGLPDSVISMFVRSHADLFYTEYYGMGHPVWDISYNNPRLMEWVFDKYLLTPYAITMTSPASYRILTGVETVTWSTFNTADSVEIWYSPDAGGSWQMISRSEPNSGSYQWHTENVSDGAYALLKIFVKNREGFIYGHDQTGYLNVDNGLHGMPFVKILGDEFTTSTVFDQDKITLKFLAGDSKTMPVNVQLLGSPDGGLHFDRFDFYTAAVDSLPRLRTINLAELTNSDHEVIKVTVDDGARMASDQTYPFIKRTPRLSGPGSQHISGQSGGVVKVHVVDPSALTGDRYRVIFNDTLLSYKFYDVVDVSKGHQVVSGATGLDGRTEGPLFDGIRLLVKDSDPASIDSAGTKWETGASTPLRVTVTLPQVFAGGLIVKGFPYAADYSFTFYDHVVDTSSSAIFGKPRIPISFRVTNLTENRPSAVAFFDGDNNRQISNLDEIYILEPDSLQSLQLTWELSFTGLPPAVTLPQPGDQFVFRTFKPLRSGDVYEFTGAAVSVSDHSLPRGVALLQNYPNPFNPSTIIKFELPKSSMVMLSVYDILGREVSVLVNEKRTAGVHEVKFDAAGLSSGVYFYRLAAGTFVQARKLLLVR